MYLNKEEEVRKGIEYEDFITDKILLPAFRKKFGSGIDINKGEQYGNFDRIVMLNNQQMGSIEIKLRYCNKDDFDTTIIPYRKYEEAEANSTMDYWLVIGWNDAIGMIKMNDVKPIRIYKLERNDRKDGIKPHVEYHIKDFTIIK